MNTATQHILTTGKTTTYLNVSSRDYTRAGRVIAGTPRTGHNVSVTPGISIRLWGSYLTHKGQANDSSSRYDRTFVVGDVVEYDSYNFVFTGKIVAIGAKTVTVDDDGKRTRLTLVDFSRKNFDLDLEAIERRNADTAQAI